MTKRAIFKYPLDGNLHEKVRLNLPENAELLDVQLHGRSIALWCLVDPLEALEERTFFLAATGTKYAELDDEDGMQYLATVQTQHGLVVHVFEIPNDVD